MDSPLRFEPFTATFSTTFWKRLVQLKIDKFRLHSSEPIKIWATFQAGSLVTTTSSGSPLYFDHESFDDKDETLAQGLSIIYGNLYLFDTIESFRSFDRVALSKNREVELKTSKSVSFDGLVFADLKKYRFYYHFAHPVLAPSRDAGMFGVSRVQDISQETFESLRWKAYNCPAFFCIDETANTFVHLDAGHLHSDGPTADWTVRQFLISLALEGKHSTLDLILLRDSPLSSTRLSISIPKISEADVILVAGWERNAQGKIAPSYLDLAPLLDPLQ